VFRPDSKINRAEALKILLAAAGFDDIDEYFDTNYVNRTGWYYAGFKDVGLKDWFAKYVAYAKDKGVVSGYINGMFGPGNNITRAEVAKIIVKILGM
jgi:hypothetical protein